MGTTVAITWSGRRADAWVPAPLADWDFAPAAATIRRTERAVAAIRRYDDALPESAEPLARLLLRAEGVASSDIEGLRAPLTDVATAELDEFSEGTTPGPSAGVAAWVADNLATVAIALAHARTAPLTVTALNEGHRRLMRHAVGRPKDLPKDPGKDMVGAFRGAQGWVGGSSPLDAAYVPPPAERVRPLMKDLVAFANRDDLDPIVQAAVVHAQFELIHPYGDGNGRLGRILIGWVLVRRLSVAVPPPVSVLIAQERGAYIAGLQLFRLDRRDEWVSWLAETVTRAGDATVGFLARVNDLVAEYNRRTADVRVDAAARRVLDRLPAHPVISASLLSQELDISDRAARTALQTLADRGVVEPLDVRPRQRGRPRSWWVARELVELLNSWRP